MACNVLLGSAANELIFFCVPDEQRLRLIDLSRIPQLPSFWREPTVAPFIRAMAAVSSCTFYMLDADFVRYFHGTYLPFLQQIREEHPQALVKTTID